LSFSQSFITHPQLISFREAPVKRKRVVVERDQEVEKAEEEVVKEALFTKTSRAGRKQKMKLGAKEMLEVQKSAEEEEQDERWRSGAKPEARAGDSLDQRDEDEHKFQRAAEYSQNPVEEVVEMKTAGNHYIRAEITPEARRQRRDQKRCREMSLHRNRSRR
jgi:hypothetical protein